MFEGAGSGVSSRELVDNLDAAAARVDYRLTFTATEKPRACHSLGIDGPDLPNAYYGREGHERAQPTGSGSWDDPDHPDVSEDEQTHIDRWMVTAVREAVHESLEWFWVDGEIFLDPHGPHEHAIHDICGRFAAELLALRQRTTPEA